MTAGTPSNPAGPPSNRNPDRPDPNSPAASGIWHPLPLPEVERVFRDLPGPWWIGGGWALDLFLGRQTRDHADIDVVVLRRDQLVVQFHLSTWELHQAEAGKLTRWMPGDRLRGEVHSVWARAAADAPWAFEILWLETEGDEFVYRRSPEIRLPLEDVGRVTKDDFPYLRPELQLLYKARYASLEKNQEDFRRVEPRLGEAERAWLASALAREFPEGHDWQRRLRPRNERDSPGR
jgi:hypothetical protein